MLQESPWDDLAQVDQLVATVEFYAILLVMAFIFVIIMLRPKRTLVQWGVTAKVLAFNLILWSIVFARANELQYLPQPWRLIINTTCLVLLLFCAATLVAHWLFPLFGREPPPSQDGEV
jgi:hypothetical protein